MSHESRSAKRLLWIVLALVASVAAVMIFLDSPLKSRSGDGDDDADIQIRDIAPAKGAFAPEFSLFNLNDNQIRLSDFKGHPIVLNFWATWCAPCRVEMPAIQDRFEEFSPEGLVVIAINYGESKEEVQAFRDELDLTFEFLLDPKADIQRLYRIRGYPTSIFLDSQGVIQIIHIGVLNESLLDDYLTQVGLEP